MSILQFRPEDVDSVYGLDIGVDRHGDVHTFLWDGIDLAMTIGGETA